MAKIFSARAELTVLRGLFHKDRAVSGTILGSIDESYFYREAGLEVYEKVKASLAEDGKVPKYKSMLDDPDLSDEAREYLRESDAVISTISDAKRAVKVLNKYRKRRGLHSIAHRIDSALSDSKTNLGDLEEEVSQALVSIKASKSSKDAFLTFGKGNNSTEFVRDLIFAEEEDDLIPTGLKTYDDVNGGFFRGSLVTIGGNSGAGKSQVASALAVNMASFGYKVLLVPLEMSKKEMTSRIIANIAKVDSLKVLRKNLGADKERVYKKYRRWVKKTKAKGGSYTIFKPDADLTIEEIYASISSYSVDVVIVDYISLLRGVDGDDQWKQLGAVARYAKINAEITNRVNILLAQVSDEGKIRYAGAIREHSSNAWVFVADKDTKEQGILKVEQPKSRTQVSFPFTIKIDYSTSTVSDIENDYHNDDHDDSQKKKKKSSAPNLAAQPDV